MSSYIFRILVFLLLVGGGYYYSRKLKSNKLNLTLVLALLVAVVAGFIVLSKRLFGLFGFSMYLIIIVGGFMIGILAGMRNKNKPG